MSSASEIVGASLTHVDHPSARVQTVSHLHAGIVPQVSWYQRHRNTGACIAADTIPVGRDWQQGDQAAAQ